MANVIKYFYALSIFQLVTLRTYTSMSAADTDHNISIQHSTSPAGWRLSARTDKKKYKTGEEIRLTVTITNQASLPMSIFHGNLLYDYRVTLRRGSEEIPIDKSAIAAALGGGAWLHEVAPGKALKNESNISVMLGEKASLPPGQYSVDLRRDFRDRFTRSKTALDEGRDTASCRTEFEILSK